MHSIFPVLVSIFYFLNGILQLKLAFALKHRFSEHNLSTSIATVLLWIFASISYPYLIQKAEGSLPNYEFHSFFWIVIFTPFCIFIILFYQYTLLKKKPELREKRQPKNLEIILKNTGDEGDNYSTYVDLKRKLLHLVPAVLIIVLYFLGIRIMNVNLSYYLIITVGYLGIYVFAMLDLVRFSWLTGSTRYYELLPNNVLELMTSAMKPKELIEFIKSSALILAMIPVFFFDFGIFVATALIATIGDGCASIFGKTFGKKKFPRNSPKTVIGYIAGFLGSLCLALTSILIFQPEYVMEKTVFLSFTAAILFFLVDISNARIDDNILNSIVIGIITGLFSILL